jgi:sugar lactone lactonase YvrE
LQSSFAKTLVDVRSGLKFVKSPRWFDQKLLFLDVHDRRIKSVDLDGSVEMVTALPYVPGRDGSAWVAGSVLFAVHVSEGGKVDQQITTERPVFSVSLGGPHRRHLFLCTSESNDPVIIHQASNATIDVAEIEIPLTAFSGELTAILS